MADADLLVKARDSDPHADPRKDRMRWRRGMVVEVRDSLAPRGRLEALPDFYWVRLLGVSAGEAEQFAAHQYPAGFYQSQSFHLEPGTVPYSKWPGAPEIQVPRSVLPYRRRDWILRLDNLPAAALATLESTGTLTVGDGGDLTWAEFKPALWSQLRQRAELRNGVRKPKPNALDPDPVT